MLWGQRINVYTNHKNLKRDSLGLTSDRVTRWRILLEEYAPKIIYIKGIHNTVADAISRLDYDPKLNSTNEYNHATHVRSTKEGGCQNWLMFSKFWTCYNKTQDPVEANTTQMNHVFANRSEEDEIYPLTVKEIVEAHKRTLHSNTSINAIRFQIKDWNFNLLNTKVVYAIKVGS